MDATLDPVTRTFIEVSEVWVPRNGVLVHAQGNYGDLEAFAAASGRESFAHGEGLPGKAWAEGRPVVLKTFDGSYFKRAEAADLEIEVLVQRQPFLGGQREIDLAQRLGRDGGDFGAQFGLGRTVERGEVQVVQKPRMQLGLYLENALLAAAVLVVGGGMRGDRGRRRGLEAGPRCGARGGQLGLGRGRDRGDLVHRDGP